MKYRPPETEKLLKFVDFLFESNEDLTLALIGGLAVQGIISHREVRKTSDIDIAIKSKEEALKLTERFSQERNFRTYYNQALDKYSIYDWDVGIHIDVYPEKIGIYKFDDMFWLKIVCPESSSLCYASPEDLFSIKLYAYLTSERGKQKHLLDIYSIILGKVELDVAYLSDRLKYLARTLGMDINYILKVITERPKNTLAQFNRKEIRMLAEEIEYLGEELKKYLH